MALVGNVLAELEEGRIAQEVGIRHDGARSGFPLARNTARTFGEYAETLGRYYAHHLAHCVAVGGTMSPAEASGRAQEIIEREYRRRHGDIVTAFNDAHDGTNGGLRVQLDIIAEALKSESVERYIRGVFNRHVAPNSWPKKVEIMGQLLRRYGAILGPAVDVCNPERYASEYSELIRAFVNGLHQSSAVFRRL